MHNAPLSPPNDPDRLLREFQNEDLALPDLEGARFSQENGPERAWSEWETTPAGMIPRWWPSKDPRNGRPLSQHQRHRWFVEELEANLDQFSPRETYGRGETATLRKQAVARSLLLMLYAVNGQSVSIPDWL